MDQNEEQTKNNDQWAVVDLMGHAQAAGRISRPDDWGGLLRVDVPMDDGSYHTEYYGMAAIYSIKMVSKEIAMAYATQASHEMLSYDAPIVSREEHHAAISKLQQSNYKLQEQNQELVRRLTAVSALPEPQSLFQHPTEDDDLDDQEDENS